MSDLISYQLEDGIATLTLSNGKVNAISPDVIAAFNAALDRAEQDRAIVVITGQAGDSSVYQAGTYLDEVVQHEGEWRYRSKRVVYDTLRVPTLLATPI